jgi:hypothetical protein
MRIEILDNIYNEKYKQYLYYHWVFKSIIPSFLPSNFEKGQVPISSSSTFIEIYSHNLHNNNISQFGLGGFFKLLQILF